MPFCWSRITYRSSPRSQLVWMPTSREVADAVVVDLRGRERAVRAAADRAARPRSRASGRSRDGRRVLEPLVRERVAGDRASSARVSSCCSLDGRVGARAGDADREQHDRRVDDVAAVAPAVARDELEQRAGRPGAADELDDDRRQHERAEGVGDQPGRRRAGAEQRSATTPATSAAPIGQRRVRTSARTDARRQAISGPIPISSSSGSPKMRRKKSKYGRPIVRCVPWKSCGQDREDHAPEDRQAERDEQQVVVEERRLARERRLELRPRAQQRQPPEDQRRARRAP